MADLKFGPITILRRKGLPPKKIPWAAFKLSEDHWKRVKLCADILAVRNYVYSTTYALLTQALNQDANAYQQVCSSSHAPTLHNVIPAMESLSSRWEAKEKKAKYAIFHDALKAALKKLLKYYEKIDDARAYILALCKCGMTYLTTYSLLTLLRSADLHPYYKLLYIQEQWGGEAEFEADLRAGNTDAINWVAYARGIVEDAVRLSRSPEHAGSC